MNTIYFSLHARQQMLERGATEKEVQETVLSGEKVPVNRTSTPAY